jgi:creatinine amidohydrolase/Fe(II)-dependent formamide hydrolase-like protein
MDQDHKGDAMNTGQPAPFLRSKKRQIVILPIGSCEQHGPHLPMDTDLRIAQLLASKLAQSLDHKKPLLLPAIPFSCSWEHKGIGTLSLTTSTLAAVIHDIAKSLKAWNTPMLLVIVNWHGGNDILAPLAIEITATEDIPTVVIPAISQVGKAWDESGITAAKEVHAGGIETSIMQAFWPELISGTISAEDHYEPTIKPAKAQAVLQAIGMIAATKTGIWGAPEKSDPEKGKALIDALAAQMCEQTAKILEIVESTKKGK